MFLNLLFLKEVMEKINAMQFFLKILFADNQCFIGCNVYSCAFGVNKNGNVNFFLSGLKTPKMMNK